MKIFRAILFFVGAFTLTSLALTDLNAVSVSGPVRVGTGQSVSSPLAHTSPLVDTRQSVVIISHER